jgi:hypothetical protein
MAPMDPDPHLACALAGPLSPVASVGRGPASRPLPVAAAVAAVAAADGSDAGIGNSSTTRWGAVAGGGRRSSGLRDEDRR